MVWTVLPVSLLVHHRLYPEGKLAEQMLCRGTTVERRLPMGGCSLLRNKLVQLQASNRSATVHHRGLHKLTSTVPANSKLDIPHGIIPEPKKRKRVSFNLEANQVQIFVRSSDLALGSIPVIELWWSSEELLSNRCNGKLDALVKESVHQYCRAYDRAHCQVHTERKLSTANLAALVRGLALGYRGLEHYSAVAAVTQRKLSVRDHVLSVVQCHRDHFSEASFHAMEDSSHGSGTSNRSCGSTVSTHTTTGCVHLERTVRYHSAKLSAGDRHFAFALGKAHFMAATTCANDEAMT
jgi:hypothetical protein